MIMKLCNFFFFLLSLSLFAPTTLSHLTSPRFGVANTSAADDRGRHLFTFFPGTPTWPPSNHNLTYALTSISAVSIPASTLRPVFSRAFDRWAAVSTLTFTEVNSDVDPDITIGFFFGDHGDGAPFDGKLGMLAHSFPPTDGRCHFDAAEDWVAEGDVADAASSSAVDLESVALHEIGHLLGLNHVLDKDAIMYPSLATKTRKVVLSKDDVEGIQKLYGKNPNFTGFPSAAADGGVGGVFAFALVGVGVVAAGLPLLPF